MIDWDSEITKIAERLTATDAEIQQTEQQRDEIVQRYDQRLSVLYTEGVNLNGEARFARRMKAEQEARHQETQQAESLQTLDAGSGAAEAAEDSAAPTPEATADTSSPESPDPSELPRTASTKPPLVPAAA